MAAISVDGRCRERNPPDQAIFGGAGDRLVERFVDPAEGQALLARCTGEGTAEGTALLSTAGGPRRFRISLWRQRGGERIRILAAFAAVGDAPSCDGEGPAPEIAPPPPEVLLAEALGTPVEAVLAIAARLREAQRSAGAEDEGSSRALAALIGAGWRLRRLSDDLRTLREMRRPQLPVRMAEVDAGRLLRRVAEIAQASAGPAPLALSTRLPPAGPLVMSDEAALWSLMELALGAVAAAGTQAGATVLALACPDPGAGAGAVIEIRAEDAGEARPGTVAWPPGAAVRVRQIALTEATGATAAFLRTGDGLAMARLQFAPSRCLDPA